MGEMGKVSDMDILTEAAATVSGDRQKDYGHPRENLACIAAMWNAYLTRKTHIIHDLSPRDVAQMMVLLKVARDANKTKRDNLVDEAGYARAAEMADEAAFNPVSKDGWPESKLETMANGWPEDDSAVRPGVLPGKKWNIMTDRTTP